MKVLIFDTILDGHHSDYIAHLTDYWLSAQWPGELYIVTPPGLEECLASDLFVSSRIKFIRLSDQELLDIRSSSMVRRSFISWNLYIKYARQIQPSHALLMYFDIFQMGIWLGRKSPCPVSGIYFRPHFPDMVRITWKQEIVKIRKSLLIRRILANRSLHALFYLDKSVIPAISRMTSRVKIVPLSDPVRRYPVTSGQTEALRQSLGLEKDRKVFLVFGYLDSRKGIEPILEAIGQLSRAESAGLALVLAGPISDGYRRVIDHCLAGLDTNAQVVTHYEVVKGADIQVFFDISDFVLTLYQKHVGMSSNIVRSAMSQKPLVSSNYGYMGYLVNTHKLGITVDSEWVPAISGALVRALRGEVNISVTEAEKISSENAHDVFARQVLEVVSRA
jgi:glycosyltransferase involved in cell wall biosynthesis